MANRGTQLRMVILALALGASTAAPAAAQMSSNIASVQLTVTKAPGATLSELPRSMPAGAAQMDARQREVSVNVPFTLQVRTAQGPKLLVAAPAGAVPLDSLPDLLAAAGHSDTDGPIVLELVLNAGI